MNDEQRGEDRRREGLLVRVGQVIKSAGFRRAWKLLRLLITVVRVIHGEPVAWFELVAVWLPQVTRWASELWRWLWGGGS